MLMAWSTLPRTSAAAASRTRSKLVSLCCAKAVDAPLAQSPLAQIMRLIVSRRTMRPIPDRTPGCLLHPNLRTGTPYSPNPATPERRVEAPGAISVAPPRGRHFLQPRLLQPRLLQPRLLQPRLLQPRLLQSWPPEAWAYQQG